MVLRSAASFMLIILFYVKLNSSFVDYDDPLTRDRYAQFHCYKYKTCTSGSPKVCAFNPATQDLAEFEDRCTIHKFNCNKKEYYKEVNMTLCKSKEAFLQYHNESLQFEHVNNTYGAYNSTPSTASTALLRLIPGVVKLTNKS